MLNPRNAFLLGTALAVCSLLCLTSTHGQQGNTQRESRAQRFNRTGRSRQAPTPDSTRATRAPAERSAPAAISNPAAAAKPSGESLTARRAVSVEILFVEFETPNAADAARLKLTGNTKDVERQLKELRTKRQLKTLQRMHLSAVDGKTASSQIGETLMQVSGTNRFGGRGVSRSYAARSYGTLAQVTPHVADDDTVAVELSLEKSWPKSAEKPSEPDETVQPAGSATITSKNSIRLKNDFFEQISCISDESTGSIRRTVIMIRVRLGKEPVQPAKTKTTTQIIKLKHVPARDVAEILGKVFTSRGITFAADTRTNSLIITASDGGRIPEATRIIAALDVPAAPE